MPPTESRNRKIQYGRQAAILKMTSLKINRLQPIYISIVPLTFGVDIQSQSKVRVWKPKIQYGCQAAILKVMALKINIEIEIPKQNWLMLRKPCRLQTDGRTDRRTDGRTDGRTDKVNPVHPPPHPPPPSNFVGRGYKNNSRVNLQRQVFTLVYRWLHLWD